MDAALARVLGLVPLLCSFSLQIRLSSYQPKYITHIKHSIMEKFGEIVDKSNYFMYTGKEKGGTYEHCSY